MAPSRKRRTNSLANLLGDVIDDAKDLVDDTLDRAKDWNPTVRHGARRAVDRDDRDRDEEIDSLRSAMRAMLTVQVSPLFIDLRPEVDARAGCTRRVMKRSHGRAQAVDLLVPIPVVAIDRSAGAMPDVGFQVLGAVQRVVDQILGVVDDVAEQVGQAVRATLAARCHDPDLHVA